MEMNQMHEPGAGRSHPEQGREAQRSTWISVAVNLVLTLAQVVVGLLAASQALVADGIHSLSDLLSDFVVLLAIQYSRKAPDADHHYGHQRYENAASLVVGALLLSVAVGMLWSAGVKLLAPAAIPQVDRLALWVALFTLVAKEGLFRYLLAVARRLRSSLLEANAWHSRSDAASSLVVAIGIGGNLLGYGLLDPIAALLVGLMVLKMGWEFLWNALKDLTDHAASEPEMQAIRSDILATPGVLGVHDLRTRRTGDLILVDVHLEIDGDLSVRQGHQIAEAVEARVLERHPVLHILTHVDPV